MHSGSKASLAFTGYFLCASSLSLTVFVYQRCLVPLFASGPTNQYLDKFVLGSTVLAALQPVNLKLKTCLLWVAATLAYAPLGTYWIAVWMGRRGDPVLGPVLTHATVLFPTCFSMANLVVTCASSGLTSPKYSSALQSFLALGLYISTALIVPFLSTSTFLRSCSIGNVLHALSAGYYLFWASTYLQTFPATEERSKKKRKPRSNSSPGLNTWPLLYLAFTALYWPFHKFTSPPILQHPLPTPFVHPISPLKVHTAVESLTGLILVGEALPKQPDEDINNILHSVRYLRASHSILGGVWLGRKVMLLENNDIPVHDSFGTPLGDSIYAAFVVQEGVRLINSTSHGLTSPETNALVIGLGIGTSATAFLRHGIDTTIIEIDPAVYTAARQYFGLPDPGTGNVFLEDARGWVQSRTVSQGNTKLYDFVIHDCFSGGGVPEHLFTTEFWNELKSILRPDGIVAINFAGVLVSDASRMIYHTLINSFSQCRGFHDLFDSIREDQLETEFINVVWFCTPSKTPLDFRQSKRSDYLGSPLRQHILRSWQTREIDPTILKSDAEHDQGFVLTDERNPLGALQRGQGPHHWKVMREVMPDMFWETY